MLDSQILAACIADRTAYERIKDHVKVTDFSPAVAFWYGLVCEYYGRDKDAPRINGDLIRQMGEGKIANPKHTDAILSALDNLPSTVSPANVVSYVLDLRRSNLALEFASSVSSNDRKKSDKLFQALAEIWDKTELVAKSEIQYARDWDTLDELVGRDKRIPLGPASLDDRIGGGVLPGHHVLVFGRTEIGKSCFVISAAANLLRRGASVLYVGNEDEINILKARMRLALCQKTQDWVDSHPNKSRKLLEPYTDKLTMVKVTPGSMSELEDLTAKHTPSVLILDQIRNLAGPEDGMTQRMEANSIRFRSLLNRQRIVGISVTQAGDRSQGHNQDGPVYLSAGDVDSSRVGLPGQVDLMLGIGANRDMLSRGMRMISFAKNKLASGASSREPLLVTFDLTRSIVTDGN